MNSRERLIRLIGGEPADRCGLWLGNPHGDTWPLLHEYFGTSTPEELRRQLHDDFRWIAPWSAYNHPGGQDMFDLQPEGEGLSAGGGLSACEDVAEVEEFNWPDPQYFDFSDTIDQLRNAGPYYRASGFWSQFFHLVADIFGMEQYFIKMHTHPDVVHAVTQHVVDAFIEGNTRLFEQAGDLIDGFFFGNDFGTQLDLLVSPDAFEEFVFPYFRQLTEHAQQYDLQVILHSCGAIHKVIPNLIDLGVDALHPLQAKANNMDAETLAADFKGKVSFIGGIDTQQLLVNADPEEVKDDVRRVKELLGPNLVVSPSHEAVLPNIPPENIEAMAEAALEE